MAFMSPTMVQNTKIISLIGTGHGMSHFYGLALAPLFPLIKAEFGVSYAALGFLVTMLNITGTIVQVPVGFLADRMGGRILLPLGLGLMAFPFLAFGYADSYWFALVLMAIAGIGSSVFHPVDYAILNATIEESFLGRAFSLHTFSGSIGVMIAPGTMVLLASIWDWRTALVIAGGFGIFFMLLMIANGHLLHGKNNKKKEIQETEVSTNTTSGIKTLFLPQVLLMVIFYVLITVMMSGILTFSVTIFNKFNGISLVDATTILTSYVIAGSVGLITGGILADKWNRHTLTAVVALLVSAVLLAVIEAFSLPIILLTLALVVIGFLQATIRPARDMIVRSIIPKNSIGKVFGFLSAAMSAGHAIAPVFVGWLIDRGNHDIVFYVLAAIMLLAIPTITLAQSPAILRGLEAGTETAAEKSAAE
jgi:MFS transporter, FSR family, fosmidomycin resistance protein